MRNQPKKESVKPTGAKQMKTNKKFTVSFLDKNRIKADVELNITYRNGYKEFTMSAHHNGHYGQCQDNIVPANEHQKALLELDKYHLNGMKPGTDEQMAIVNRMKKYDFDKAVKLLKKKRKYTVKHPQTGKPHKYGSGWVRLALPKNIETLIQRAIDGINAEEFKRKAAKSELLIETINECTDEVNIDLKSMDDTCLMDFISNKQSVDRDEAERIAALVKMFDLSEDDLQDVSIDGTRVTVQGEDYIMGTDGEMDYEWEEYIDSYIDDCVLGEIKDTHLKNYFDRERFMEDCKMDGRGHSLNKYDGGEEYAKVNETYYYAYKQ